MGYLLKYRKVLAGTFVVLVFLWVTVLTVDNYFGRPDMAFLILSLSACPLVIVGLADKKEVLGVSAVDILAAAWFAYSLLNALARWTCQTEDALIPVVSTFVLYVVLRLTLSRRKNIGRVVVAGIAFAGLYECTLGLLQLYGLAQSNHNVFKITGSFFNPGPYSVYVVMTLAVCLSYCCKRFRIYPPKRHWNWTGRTHFVGNMLFLLCAIGCVVGLLTLPATLSRTAFAALAIVLLILTGRKKPKVAAIVLLLILVFGFVLYFLKKDSADGRLLMWFVSLRAISRHPLFGCGLGSFHKVFSDSQKEYFISNPESSLVSVAGSPEYAFNDYLEIGVEQGLAGMLFFVSIIAIAIGKLLKKREETGLGLMALAVCAMFSYPFNLLPFRIAGCIFIAYAAILDERPLAKITGWRRSVVTVAACLACVFLLVPVYGRVKSKLIATKDFAMDKILRIRTIDDSHLQRAKTLSDCPKYLFWLGKRLMAAGRYEESLEAFSLGSEVSCDNMFYVMMGKVCSSLKRSDAAEDCFLTAHYMQPCKIYPLYQLLLLYESDGKTDNAEEVARIILDTKPKVRSAATDEMKTYALDFLDRIIK